MYLRRFRCPSEIRVFDTTTGASRALKSSDSGGAKAAGFVETLRVGLVPGFRKMLTAAVYYDLGLKLQVDGSLWPLEAEHLQVLRSTWPPFVRRVEIRLDGKAQMRLLYVVTLGELFSDQNRGDLFTLVLEMLSSKEKLAEYESYWRRESS